LLHVTLACIVLSTLNSASRSKFQVSRLAKVRRSQSHLAGVRTCSWIQQEVYLHTRLPTSSAQAQEFTRKFTLCLSIIFLGLDPGVLVSVSVSISTTVSRKPSLVQTQLS
jgi:hypothetical protein